MDKEMFDRLKQTDSCELYDNVKKISKNLGINEQTLKMLIPSPEQLKDKINSMSFSQIEDLASKLDENTLAQIKSAINTKGENNGN